MKALLSRLNRWLKEQEAIAHADKQRKSKFSCFDCGSIDFHFVTNPVFSTNRMSESRTKAMVACSTEGCRMRYVFVSRDNGKTWDPYAPSN